MKRVKPLLRSYSFRRGRFQRLQVAVVLVTVASVSLVAVTHCDPLKGNNKHLANVLPPELGQRNITSSWSSEFAPCASPASAKLHHNDVSSGKDGTIDLALANWLITADIPEFGGITREGYFEQLDSLVARVQEAIASMERNASPSIDPKAPCVRCARFCNAIIKLGFAYREEFRKEELTPAQMKALYRDPDNLFLTGMLQTHRGSCVSMPILYLVVGQRLGLPVHLVTVGKHYFIRWEEPGFRMNIEPTIVEQVAVTPDDSVYLEAEGMTQAQVKGSQLRNLTDREVVGEILFIRSAYWAAKGPRFQAQQCQDLFRAGQLAPDDPGIKATMEATFKFYGIKSELKPFPIGAKS